MISKEAIEALFALLGREIDPIETEDGATHILVPPNWAAKRLDPIEPVLKRIRQAPRFYDTESFCAYVNAFKLPQSQLFAKPASFGGPSLSCVFDYHHTPESPGRLAHIATYEPALSEEWKTWTEAAARRFTQVEFAEFIEENRRDINAPDAAVLLDIVTRFRASKKVDFDSVVYQPDGSAMIAYSEKVESAGKGVPVPTELTVGIPVYFGGPRYALRVYLRYRVADGRVVFTLKLDNQQPVERSAFEEIATLISGKTGLRALLGQHA